MRKFAVTIALMCAWSSAHANIYGVVQGVVHDPQHRPISAVRVTLKAVNSALTWTLETPSDGGFHFSSVPLGEYVLSVTAAGFADQAQTFSLASGTSAVMHIELALAGPRETVDVDAPRDDASATPMVLIDRQAIAETPGAGRTNSMAMITDFVPGAYMTHDMLHMRGGHQVSWQIDGVEIPNTNIASNLGAQIDPKDIDTIEVQRGSYTADLGDRTYGVFNVVPRTGFERDRQGEVLISAGNFLQTNDQISFGDHTDKFAYYASLNGNRTDYGLSPPTGKVAHDAANGYGGFSSLIWNRTAKDQLRLITQLRGDYFQIPYDPDPNSFGNAQYNSSGWRDGQHETDGLAAFSWLHTFNASTVLQVSPFFHHNGVDYEGAASDIPVATTYTRASNYAGAQASVVTEAKRNTLQAGIFSFGQHDAYVFGVTGVTPVPDSAAGEVIEEYVTDSLRATSWLTLSAGLRQTHFQGGFAEDHSDPRFGVTLRVPRVHWVFRGFYGRFYQPPPLLTFGCANHSVSCSLQTYAQASGADFAPLRGERDEEHQFGVQIPLAGWVLDVDTFKNRVNNFLDHSNLGNSSLYFPVAVDGALVRAWEVSLLSPDLWRHGHAHLAYSNQIAEQRGAVTGGLICYPADSCGSPGFAYTPVDHDQRNTLSAGLSAMLPKRVTASTNFSYGSGFVNGDPDSSTPYPNAYLPAHTTLDLALSKTFESTTLSLTAVNMANRRVLLDDSLTFGGFHFSDPRQLYAEVRYRFHF